MHSMEHTIDGQAWYSARRGSIPQAVHPATIGAQLHLYDGDRNRLASFPLKGLRTERKGDQLTLLLDDGGATLLLPADHPLAVQLKSRERPRRGARRRLLAALGVLAIILLGIYFLFASLVPYLGLRLVSPAQESALGDRLYEVMIQSELKGGATIDTATSARLQAFADQMELGDAYRIRITVVRSPVFNAYALPGGHMVVYTGILHKLYTAESLAALLAHERSHINGRHSLRSLLRKASTAILVATLFGDSGGIMAAIVANAETVNGLSYARRLEKEADAEGMRLLVQKGIDPAGMVQLMKEMEKAEGGDGGYSLLRTHPHTADRKQWAEAFIRSAPQRSYEAKELHSHFRAVKNALSLEQ